ncbi:hypothetical protein [Flavobacterium sp. CGRL2]
MKNIFLNSFFGLSLFIITSCSTEVETPKLVCTQPDFTVNKNVEKVYELSNNTAKQYLYDDIIEAYVVSSDEDGNFF